MQDHEGSVRSGQPLGRSTDRPTWTARRAVVVIAFCLAAAGVAWSLLRPAGTRGDISKLVSAEVAAEPVDQQTVARIEAFCSDCHGMPRPENYPRDAWYDGVRSGYEYYAHSGRTDLDPPPPHQTLAFFRQRAPEKLEFPQPPQATRPLGVRFSVERLSFSQRIDVPPAVSGLQWTSLTEESPPVLLVSDVRHGGVHSIDLATRPRAVKEIAAIQQPCHVETCDLDGDGDRDLVVAELGSTTPFDHNLGRVLCLQRGPYGNYQTVVLADQLGRIADVRCADMDGDGDLDCVVAEFGAERTGSVLLLRNVTPEGGPLRMDVEEIDLRPGTVHVPVRDLDGDGRLDFVALISEEYECIEAFINKGDAEFSRQPLWAGPDPLFGSSGIQLVDLDQDDDFDILYTNGDMFDDGFVKPCHGVRWLENQQDWRFQCHLLANLPGAYRAEAADIDLDGDLDILVVAWVSKRFRPLHLDPAQMPSILCLEQTAPGVFERHTLEKGMPYHAVMEVADFDHDGDLDFAVGLYSVVSTLQFPYAVEIWWNQATDPASPASS